MTTGLYGICELCGEPMPAGEEMFKFHGYSGNCPKPPLPFPKKKTREELESELAGATAKLARYENAKMPDAEPVDCRKLREQGLMYYAEDYDALRDFAARASVDAERYRYAKENLRIGIFHRDSMSSDCCCGCEDWDDAAIDAAMKGSK